jgi:hypothetical protein
MDVSNRYVRWLLMMFTVMGLGVAGSSVLNGEYALACISIIWSFLLLIYYRRGLGPGGLRQVAADFGAGIASLAIFLLAVWVSMLIIT